ncbi:hypothetical protein F2P79_006766 [Pimephales promelas]|nr:hypothetical protein F2P79_006766 [Pimephales promelas]
MKRTLLSSGKSAGECIDVNSTGTPDEPGMLPLPLLFPVKHCDSVKGKVKKAFLIPLCGFELPVSTGASVLPPKRTKVQVGEVFVGSADGKRRTVLTKDRNLIQYLETI